MQGADSVWAESGRAERAVIVHCHMFKNAGSTLDWCLSRNFGGRFLQLWNDPDGKTEDQQLELLLHDREDLCAVSGHRLSPPFPDVAGVKLLPAFIIRNPIERAYSVYCFEREQAEVTPGSRKAKRLSFRDYIRWRMDPRKPLALRNFQSAFCAGKRRGRDPAKIFEQALQNLRAAPLVATLELYDSSMVVFEQTLRPYFGELDLSYVKQNVGKYRDRAATSAPKMRVLRKLLGGMGIPARIHNDSDLDARVNRTLDLLGSEVGDLLVAGNQFDLKLYAEATALVKRRLRAVESLERELRNFSGRCAGLNSQVAVV
jgi:hypothetical protein